MGENALPYRQDTRYPGLVRPYLKENGCIDPNVIDSGSKNPSRTGVSNQYTRMNEHRMKQKQNNDPFSRYDDELGEEHYFLVPKVQGNKLKICEWRKTVETSRSLRNIAKLAEDTNKRNVGSSSSSLEKDRTLAFPPFSRTIRQNFDNNSLKDQGEYCFISSNSRDKNLNKLKEQKSPRLRNSSYHHKDGERFRDFASKFATAEEDEGCKPQSHSHSFSERKRDAWVELEGITDSNTNTVSVRSKLDDAIEHCTCMSCVRGIFYHCTKDDEDGVIDSPCSCAGSKGSVFKRWVLLTLLGCLMPCIFCYLPARGCVNLCRKCGRSKSKENTNSNLNLKVRYKKPDRRKAREDTTLL